MTNTTTTTTTHEALTAAVRALAEETGLTLNLGYVGNVDANGRTNDSRLWTVWIANARGGDALHPSNMTRLAGYVGTDELGLLLEYVTAERLAEVLRRDGVYPVRVEFTPAGEVSRARSAELIAEAVR